jgi:hypothetical protein
LMRNPPEECLFRQDSLSHGWGIHRRISGQKLPTHGCGSRTAMYKCMKNPPNGKISRITNFECFLPWLSIFFVYFFYNWWSLNPLPVVFTVWGEGGGIRTRVS